MWFAWPDYVELIIEILPTFHQQLVKILQLIIQRSTDYNLLDRRNAQHHSRPTDPPSRPTQYAHASRVPFILTPSLWWSGVRIKMFISTRRSQYVGATMWHPMWGSGYNLSSCDPWGLYSWGSLLLFLDPTTSQTLLSETEDGTKQVMKERNTLQDEISKASEKLSRWSKRQFFISKYTSSHGYHELWNDYLCLSFSLSYRVKLWFLPFWFLVSSLSKRFLNLCLLDSVFLSVKETDSPCTIVLVPLETLDRQIFYIIREMSDSLGCLELRPRLCMSGCCGTCR